MQNTYDDDGNIITLKRYGSFDNLIDDFNYQYFQNTNKLRRVSGTTDQYEYDGSGNMTKDDLNTNYGIKYDYRNLITEFYALRMESGNPKTYYTRNNYDETGNRVRKRVYKYIGSNPVPDPFEDGDNLVNWQLLTDTYYFRSINGNEVAVYNSYDLLYWNVADTGKINSDGSWNFYLKDHLGSIRAVTNESHDILSAQDYDMWGQILENRSYEVEEDKYKFTGKERDFIGQFPLTKRGYDYFGARYYDARVGRWGSVDGIDGNLFGQSGYLYCGNSPTNYVDPLGLDWYFYLEGSSRPIVYPEMDERHYFQHARGNLIVNVATGEYAALLGLTFFEADNKLGVNVLFEDIVKDKPYSSSMIDYKFELSTVPEILNSIKTNNLLEIYFIIFRPDINYLLTALRSRERKLYDFKVSFDHILTKPLYILDGKLINVQEAGNYLWGAMLKQRGIDLNIAKYGAHLYSRWKNNRWDEPNEQQMIDRGWEYNPNK